MSLYVEILTPSQTLVTGQADEIVAPSVLGEAGVLPQHTDYVTLLGEGQLIVKMGPQVKEYTISGGLLEIAKDKAKVLIDSIVG